jgi:acyl dehydratase
MSAVAPPAAELPPPPPAPAERGERIVRVDRYSREDIENFAVACHDRNPLHSDDALAQRSRFGEVIASGQHTSSMLLGLVISRFAHGPDGRAREVLLLHVNFAFRAPIFANEDIQLSWDVAEVNWNAKLRGHVLMVEGGASTARARPALIARGTLLVKAAP